MNCRPRTLTMSGQSVCRFLALLLALLAAAHAQQAASCPHAKRGHNKPFGHHARHWRRVDTRYDAITAEEFYAQYVRPSKPVVVRGGIADWPAVEKWHNLTYFEELGGDLMFSVDFRRLYDFDNHHVSRRSLTIKDYVTRMDKESVYMDSPISDKMFKDMLWPQVMNCEYFIKRMRTPSFFFNNGKSNTDIHIDGTETLFFQISGSRLWLMTPPENAAYMYAGREAFYPHSGISKINQRAVNLTELPNVAKATMYAAVVNPGDLIYVPESWFHNVMTRGSPNQATTVFFDSSRCEKLYLGNSIVEYITTCDKFRGAFLPDGIKCPKKLPKGTTFLDVAKLHGHENEHLLPGESSNTEKMREREYKRIMRSIVWKKPFRAPRMVLPRMALNADMTVFLDRLRNKSGSILQTHYTLISVTPQDIPPLARHLQHFKVPRKSLQLLLTLPADVSGRGAEASLAWLQEALGSFGAFPVGAIDLLLMEAPECVPASAKAQDCERDAAIDEHRLATWAALVAWQREGRVRLLGVKDVSSAELRRLHTAFPGSVSVVSFRFDPLYRQINFRRTAEELQIPALMAHSTCGSGWVRAGLAKENPIHSNEPILMYAFEDSRSVYAFIYEWVIRRGFLLLPERVEKPERADIEFDIILHLMGEEENRISEEILSPLVPEDKDYFINFALKKRKKQETI